MMKMIKIRMDILINMAIDHGNCDHDCDNVDQYDG